jgi:hypothetical protein
MSAVDPHFNRIVPYYCASSSEGFRAAGGTRGGSPLQVTLSRCRQAAKPQPGASEIETAWTPKRLSSRSSGWSTSLLSPTRGVPACPTSRPRTAGTMICMLQTRGSGCGNGTGFRVDAPALTHRNPNGIPSLLLNAVHLLLHELSSAELVAPTPANVLPRSCR